MIGTLMDKADFPEIVGAGELIDMLGVGRPRMYQITTHKDFPRPIRVLSAGKIWLLEDIQAWADARGRELHPYSQPSMSE